MKTLLILLTLLLSFSSLYSEYYYLPNDSSDAEEKISNGSVWAHSSDLEMPYDFYGDPDRGMQIVGLKFNAVDIPAGSIITSAKIRFRSDDDDDGASSLIIYGELSNDASTFSENDYDISSRTATASSVEWHPGEWNENSYYETVDISPIIQEIIDQSDYKGDDLAIFIKPGEDCTTSSCRRRADSYDHSESDAARLEINYTTVVTLQANDDTATTPVDANVNIIVLSNDQAGTDETFETVTIDTNPTNGTVTVNADNSVLYSPNSGYIGSDSFTYTVTNSASDTSNRATVTIIVGELVLGETEDFSPITSHILKGNIKVIGNTVLQSPNTSSTNSNSDLQLSYIDIDSDTTTFNSSSASIDATNGGVNISNASILWAGLYWQGYLHSNDGDDGIDSQYDIDNSQDSATSQIENILKTHTVSLQKTNGIISNGTLTSDYVAISPDKVLLSNIYNDSSYVSYVYSAFADVTQELQLQGPVDSYTLANIPTRSGETSSGNSYDGLGNFGAWSLVIIYSNRSVADEKLRNVTVFNGYKVLSATTNPEETIELTGFITPKEAPDGVSSTLSFFAGEGDKYILGDYAQLINQDGDVYDLPNPEGTDSYFSSAIEGVPTRDPIIENNNGIDIHTTQVGTSDGDEKPIGTSQTTASVKLGTTQDTFMPSMIAFSTELYSPDFCYDYAYKQQGRYFTEANDGLSSPRLSGDVLTGEDIEVTLYIKNLIDSDIEVSDMYIDVIDINTTQATYINGTTRLAKVGDLTPQTITPTSSSSSITDINIGSMNTNDYFYVYYGLNPLKSSLDMPINATLSYNLTVGGTTIPYHSILGVEMNMCSSSNFKYTPTAGLFNIVHQDYYTWDGSTGTQYYNLPTQITSRAGNFKVISLDPDANDGYNTLKGQSTIVSVELIDAAAFHDTDASCLELESAISEKIWLKFEDNVSSVVVDQSSINTSLANNFNTNTLTAADFYSNARENSAFRVSYLVTNDDAQSLIQTEKTVDGRTKILNYDELVQDLSSCKVPVYYPTGIPEVSSTTTTEDISVACSDVDTTGVSDASIQSCMTCLYGYNSKAVCSRDNFSLRPEAFLIKINDQNQSNPINQRRLADNVSGVATPDGEVLKIAAGYDYNMEVNATNHISNSASSGYTKSYNSSNTVDSFQYLWEPRNSQNVSGCNDNSSKLVNIRFFNGLIDSNTSLNQVGHYRLNIRDTSWTTVDSDYLFMTHHTSPYFLVPTATTNLDCLQNVSTTEAVNASAGAAEPLNGCIISSEHDNNSTMKYRDYNVTSYPYRFDLNTTKQSTGLDFATFTTDTYVYMADMSKDENMSYHINGQIVARGEDNKTLSNFVDSCFAVPLDLNISKSDSLLLDQYAKNIPFQVLLNNLDTNADVNSSLEYNNTITTEDIFLQVPPSYFFKDAQGSMDTRINLNYYRQANAAANPKVISYSDYNISCTNETIDCQFNADLINNKKTKGEFQLDSNITYYYARNHSPRYRFKDNNGTAYIYYELFCSGASCDTTLLQNLSASQMTDDPRWFINTQHNSGYGSANSVTQRNNNIVTGTDATGNHQDSSFIFYNESRGYPYKTTMETNSSRWLIYNKYDVNATRNSFEVEFMKDVSSWAGVHETSNTTEKKASSQTNRRSMW